MRPHRVFVDTNVLISGLLFRGNEARVLTLGAQGIVTLVIPVSVIEEARGVFRQKFANRIGVLEEFILGVQYEDAPHPSESDLTVAARLVRDPDDVPILAGILLAEPDFALTGDRDLLTDEVKAVAPVCRCAEYLDKHQWVLAMSDKPFKLEVITPDRMVLSETETTSVVLPGSLGYLGVLANHAPLMTELTTGKLDFHRADGSADGMAVSGGFIEVFDNVVTVLAENAELAGEIDLERAEKAVDRARQRIAAHDPSLDFDRAAIALKKALNRLGVPRHGN